ncbi:glycosyl transferase [Puniceicoccales bacterium CK1056]|uniref:Glycosyl transferase n=1 Tax=Oceanipulchritudo coccoides TaxID=2706888 RepID=A0A6B2M5X2_9BACT|nr:glycosyl transferase [Oceanipulchritudo coccoides]NDV63195.1 glycosyl transferase [Oceanipulchritudo coccoides]
MEYGHFDDATREYVITRPDTPLPWLNYLGMDDFFGLCTNTSGGYHFYRDAKLRRITRYRYNSVPLDESGRYLYIKDGDTVWSPAWKPARTELDSWECRHGTGYTKFQAEKDGIRAGLRFFIPRNDPVEIWTLQLENTTSEEKELTLTSYVEFCFYEANNDATNYQRTWSIGEVEIHGSAIYHTTEYRERRSHYTVFYSSELIDGFDTDQFSFLGNQRSVSKPVVVESGKPGNSVASGWNPIGSHSIQIKLAPGEKREITFLLAYIEVPESEKREPSGRLNRKPAEDLICQYDTSEKVESAFSELCSDWIDLLSRFQVETPCPVVNRMGNTWNQVQCMATFNLSRSASLFETGIGRGMGYRDSNQDLLGFVHMVPEKARQRLLDIAATQLSSGLCYHQYQPLTKKGNADIGGEFMDDHLWLLLSTTAYIKETGDFDILSENIGYADQEVKDATLGDHLWTSFHYTLDNLGPNELPLIGHADWNDCLNLNCLSTEPNESFQTAPHRTDGKVAESLMIAGLFLKATRELESLYQKMGDKDRADSVNSAHSKMLQTVEDKGWDGDWYLRAFDANGQPVGSAKNTHGKIYIESQGWLLLGGAGKDNGRARKALDSVHEHLSTDHGCVILDPPYAEYDLNLGEVSSYPPGYKENGGIFCHNNPWIHLALMQEGEGDRAYTYYKSICPAAQPDQETYKSEPYVYSQMIAGKAAKNHGEAKNAWLTGTAAWTLLSIMQGFAGLKPDYDALVLDPCIPSDWPEFKVSRQIRGTCYEIHVKNPDGVCTGIKELSVDGQPVSGNRIPYISNGGTVEVVAIIGDK